MEIQRVILNNIGLFEKLEISLAPTEQNPSNITVFVGNNGAGKTAILKALATSLSWFTARLLTEKGSGNPIYEDAIFNTANAGSIEIEVSDPSKSLNNPDQSEIDHYFRWILAKNKKGRKGQYNSNLNDCTRLANRYRDALTHDDKTSLPLIAFYPVERVVLDIPLKIRTKHTFLQLDGYDNSLSQGVDFRRFFEWFREREDTENESGVPEDVLNQLRPIMAETNQDLWRWLNERNASAKDRQLTAVRTAISRFMPHLDNLRVRRRPRLYVAVDKNGETLNLAQLSQGEKSLMALVGDIARRLAMLNPALENPLAGDGIVLIDEVDLHLHPSWQRRLCDRLTETFPNCQFVLTTHSPLVISDCKNVLIYTLANGELRQLPSQYGQDANTVLLDAMNTSIRNEKIDTELNDLLDAIQDSKLTEAQKLLAELSEELPANHLELVKAKLLLRKQELRHGNH
ncbi:MAG: ATP-binding protein [Microcystis panniformis Mp_MB_F_20051200_S9]|uniref:ATP-binding protein n=1 Tax=Microcystis panniformis Mp_MB_F_20051200_S9 TaxID=2486223 RepID=A0A552PTK9_9CHRO|nr:MAG: ATP-binding protein [Microcystis panniformis Mp_GB_SS_20050300_S99]TRV50342.1 MAG: ATP-binding protein [Microcystis panniformis Mp_MB_F_20080800_S26D]TRV50740.1 MAG: ATP-binding protein [Microcystis panniformis Mp_GB_SS_20050300_S99D]TRV56637.1 MAG: ATP-binding protein [Microcystis panniformis Mp_MB_F_20080800_S26]TRV60216.1 MAG: ATP-binding protein [Microcystis panniformis Mp_MB_F_20051200_S9]TRV69330.1 MAG: ATP-binding protein [Microcystis panniformis Mp_MB_F_20051200_S9D]TRV76032.1